MGFGNAVQPPSLAAIAGAVEDAIDYARIQQLVVNAVAGLAIEYSRIQQPPRVPAWTAARNERLGDFLAAEDARQAVARIIERTGDSTPAAAAVLDALEGRVTAMFAQVKST